MRIELLILYKKMLSEILKGILFFRYYGLYYFDFLLFFFMHLVQSQQLNAEQIPSIIFVHFFISDKIAKLWSETFL